MENYDNFLNYFKELAIQHSSIQHEQNGKEAFYTIDPMEMISGVKTKIKTSTYVMILMSFSETLQHCEKDNEFLFFIMHKQKVGDYAQNNIYRDEASKIAKDIVGRINEDSKDYDNPSVFNLWNGSMDAINNVNIIHDRLAIAGDIYVGVQVSFKSKSVYCVGYRENIWLDKQL